jgi:hypothetical protein
MATAAPMASATARLRTLDVTAVLMSLPTAALGRKPGRLGTFGVFGILDTLYGHSQIKRRSPACRVRVQPMNWFLLLKWIHVVAAITAVGANLTYGIWSSRAEREPAHLGFALHGIKFVDERVANPAYGVLLLTGLLMAIFYVGFLHLWVLLGIGGALYTPALKRQIQLLDTEGPTGAAFKAAGARAAGLGVFLGVLLIAIVFVMVFKPQT